MTLIHVGVGAAATAVLMAAIGVADRANRNWPSFYRIFLLLFFTVWAVVLWLQPPAAMTPAAMLSSLALLIAAIAAGFIRLPPPKGRRETKNLLDLMETDRSLERFFRSRAGRLFWAVLALLVFSVALRISMLSGLGLGS
jgi:hypothetical protein